MFSNPKGGTAAVFQPGRMFTLKRTVVFFMYLYSDDARYVQSVRFTHSLLLDRSWQYVLQKKSNGEMTSVQSIHFQYPLLPELRGWQRSAGAPPSCCKPKAGLHYGQLPGHRATKRQTTIGSYLHAYRQFKVSNSPCIAYFWTEGGSRRTWRIIQAKRFQACNGTQTLNASGWQQWPLRHRVIRGKWDGHIKLIRIVDWTEFAI